MSAPVSAVCHSAGELHAAKMCQWVNTHITYNRRCATSNSNIWSNQLAYLSILFTMCSSKPGTTDVSPARPSPQCCCPATASHSLTLQSPWSVAAPRHSSVLLSNQVAAARSCCSPTWPHPAAQLVHTSFVYITHHPSKNAFLYRWTMNVYCCDQ